MRCSGDCCAGRRVHSPHLLQGRLWLTAIFVAAPTRLWSQVHFIVLFLCFEKKSLMRVKPHSKVLVGPVWVIVILTAYYLEYRRFDLNLKAALPLSSIPPP